jgi:Cap4, dsDNA endonuclease domain
MSLSEKLILISCREKSGATSSNRFDYQKDWTIGKLIELHTTKSDYLIICDYHEDVVILDSEKNPSSGMFVQVKTDKTNSWTSNRLVKRKNGEDGELLNSILGKLTSTVQQFSKFNPEMAIVSNARFNFKLSDGTKSLTLDLVKLSELDDSELQKIDDAIKAECGIDKYHLSFECCFEVSDLSLQDHASHTKGKILKFLEDIGHDKSANAAAIYRVLFDSVKNKTNIEASIADYQELLAKKGIGKSYIDKMIQTIASSKDVNEMWTLLQNALSQEGVSPVKLVKIKHDWEKFDIDRLDPLNEVILDLRKQARTAVSSITEENEDITLTNMASEVVKKIDPKFPKQFSDNYILVVAFRELYENRPI